ncbi:hypothetical protein ACIQBJ_21295 [Kitasatospora sp. NPDC088391]|uniref:hypothetical protein n=1 Tax=Kitasatospora sp. NPDC088391 TaxID=3364074 RepID=UPI003804A1D3
MDVVYASLDRRPGTRPAPADEADEAAEALAALWAHAGPGDGLEHARARVEPGRIDLLLFLLPPPPGPGAAADPARRAADLLARCHRGSAALSLRYLPPVPAPAPGPPGR